MTYTKEECGKIGYTQLQACTLSEPLEFTGERFTPECEREIWYEHYHRYALVRRWCNKLRTLDAACGEGYGTALLAQSTASVEGVDISEQAIAHARQRYSSLGNVNFHVADCTSLPFEDCEFDRVVSFETLEHLVEQDQLMAEFKRVLKPDGCLVLSSPDKATYSDTVGGNNEFHLKELYHDELVSLISKYFPASRLLGQKLMFHSAIWSVDGVRDVELNQFSGNAVSAISSITQAPVYHIALCAAESHFLPEVDGKLWLFDDVDESVYQHYHGEIKRNMAAGSIIADLEKQIESLKERSGQAMPLMPAWWQRWLDRG